MGRVKTLFSSPNNTHHRRIGCLEAQTLFNGALLSVCAMRALSSVSLCVFVAVTTVSVSSDHALAMRMYAFACMSAGTGRSNAPGDHLVHRQPSNAMNYSAHLRAAYRAKGRGRLIVRPQ